MEVITRHHGFTLIELVVLMAIIGILAAMVLPRLPTSSLSLEYQANSILNDIRYAQALSLTSGQRYRWVRLSASTYQLTNSAGTAVLLPSGSTQYTLTNGVSFGTFTGLPNNLIAFDTKGAPYTDTATPGTALASTALIPLTASGQTRTIAITAQTGYGALQ